jgi:hypothetical protein
MPRLFALDHNFPDPIVTALGAFQADAELVRIDAIDPRMPDLDDWELFLALHHDARPWDGLITTDSSMLRQGRELAALIQTRLTLIVAMEAGHNPVKASGLLFAHLGNICKRIDPTKPQVWRLQAVSRPHTDPWDFVSQLAEHNNRDAAAVWNENRLTPAELATDPLGAPPAV